MTTPERIETNQKNANQSTGPATPEGRAVVAANALRHGLFSDQAVLPNEDAEGKLEFAAALRAQLKPVTATEYFWVERIITSSWRLCRAARVESGIFASQYFGIVAARARTEAESYVVRPKHVSALTTAREREREEGIVTDEAARARALEMARQADLRATEEDATLGQAFVSNGADGSFARLSRFEDHIERGLFNAIRRLEREQAARKRDE
jgi:hypothetical protein